ncbi:MAG: hypothetical protein ABF293_12825 [Flavobacteriaceae bacterium]|jgi:microsomal dipeptidase-like Zn-dependent dipeptidase
MADEKSELLEKMDKALFAIDEFVEACRNLGVGLDFDDLIDDASKLSPEQLRFLIDSLDKAGKSLTDTAES